jgi:hypothetical protein
MRTDPDAQAMQAALDALKLNCGRQTESPASKAIAILRERLAQPAQTDDEPLLRRLLAFQYAGTLLYADDGELQDNRVSPFIDFKRDSSVVIHNKMIERGMKAYTAYFASITTPPAAQPALEPVDPAPHDAQSAAAPVVGEVQEMATGIADSLERAALTAHEKRDVFLAGFLSTSASQVKVLARIASLSRTSDKPALEKGIRMGLEAAAGLVVSQTAQIRFQSIDCYNYASYCSGAIRALDPATVAKEGK